MEQQEVLCCNIHYYSYRKKERRASSKILEVQAHTIENYFKFKDRRNVERVTRKNAEN